MSYSVGVEYALHCLVYLIDVPEKTSVGIKELSEFQGLSNTFLSKVFGKLSKAGIVCSVPGVKGGYKLARLPEEISFWDVVEAVEGVKPIFQCKNVLKNGLPYKDKEEFLNCASCTSGNLSCPINLTMLQAEEQMRSFLRQKTLAQLHAELDDILPKGVRSFTKEYFTKDK